MQCIKCDATLAKGRTQCSSCRSWNIVPLQGDADGTRLLTDSRVSDIGKIATGPWDPCFGGGLVRSSVALIGGSPGGGKSTMSLQLADMIVQASGREMMYLAAEETISEIRSRAERLKLKNTGLFRMVPIREGFSADLGQTILARNPCAIVVDSLQGLSGGDPAADVELCEAFKDYAVRLSAPVVIINHVNKELELAGLMKLQHVVDTLILLLPWEPKNPDAGRKMTTLKNRFGPNIQLCLDMTERGFVECPGCDRCVEDEDDEAEPLQEGSLQEG